MFRTQSASVPLGGSYTLSYKGATSTAIPHNAEKDEVCTNNAFNELNMSASLGTMCAVDIRFELLGGICWGEFAGGKGGGIGKDGHTGGLCT